jgi:rubrerythrin
MQYFNGYPYMMPRYPEADYRQMPSLYAQSPLNVIPAAIPAIPQVPAQQPIGQTSGMQELTSQFKPSGNMAPMVDMTPYQYPDNLMSALALIREAVASENEDKQFYEYLISVAPNEEEKKIITGIRDDEIHHFALFRQVYFILTGRTLPEAAEVEFEKPASYCEGLKRALMGEQGAVRKYRRIFFALQDRTLMNILIEIITDEIRHGSLYNYLYSKNSCNV